MARKGLILLLCAGVTAAACLLLTVAPGGAADEDRDAKLRSLLAVQKALADGRDFLKSGEFRAAVTVLEARVVYIDGNKEYLDALRDAYIGYIRELKQSNRGAEAATYVRRLECCDPGALLEMAGPVKAPAVAAAAAAPPKLPDVPVRTASVTAADSAPKPALAGDPFDDRNARHFSDATALRDKADKEWAVKHYVEAGKLYEQCDKAAPGAAGDSREKWAYCKLFAAFEAINDPPAKNSPSPADLERDVRQAMTLAPQNTAVDEFGKKLLAKIQERKGGTVRAAADDRGDDRAVAVRHTPRSADGGWALAETANFRVYHNLPKETAEKAARVAEKARAASVKKWFGETGRPWDPKCDLYIHATAQDYSTATGVPAGSPGHSTLARAPNSDRILGRKIDLHADDPNMLIGVLPHETTHVVLAGRFGAHDVPRWSDEGMAVLSEPRDRIDMHLRNLPRHHADGTLFAAGALMQMKDYPEQRQIGPFYAESVSLVEFLSKDDPVKFSRFLNDALSGGYEQALQTHYKIRDFAELDRRWQKYALDGAVADRGQ
jgi:hypothetical protein